MSALACKAQDSASLSICEKSETDAVRVSGPCQDTGTWNCKISYSTRGVQVVYSSSELLGRDCFPDNFPRA